MSISDSTFIYYLIIEVHALLKKEEISFFKTNCQLSVILIVLPFKFFKTRGITSYVKVVLT